MKKTLALLVALGVGSAMGGCNSSSDNNAISPPKPGKQINPSWELKIQSKCSEATPHESCVGVYGFAVYTDGHYQIGPGPKEEVREGTVSPEELELLTKALAPSLSGAPSGTDNHQNIDAGETDDVITLTRGSGRLDTLLKTQGKDLYYAISNADDAKAIHSQLKKLASKYYALPFPDGCLDETPLLQKLYASLQSCNVDADCTYIDHSFAVVPSTSADWVITDDCTVVHPLAVANSAKVASSQDKLIEAYNNIQSSCGDKFRRAECVQQAGFQPNNRAPVCIQGSCQANPSTSSMSLW